MMHENPAPGKAAGVSACALPQPQLPGFVKLWLVMFWEFRHLFGMSVETLFLLRKDRPGLRDLDDVVLLAGAVTTMGVKIPAGTEGTVVAVLRDSAAYVVEFAEPLGAIATVKAGMLMPTTLADR